MLPLVDAQWLARELAAHSSEKQADLRLLDVRWYLGKKRGRDEYAAGHLPGAVFVDLDSSLASAPRSATGGGPGRHPLPSREVFEQAMRDAGVNDGTTVVAYDDASGSIAARLWWLLRHFGHEKVAVLDGGVDAWKKNGGALTADAPQISRGTFVAKHVYHTNVVDRDAVTRAIANGALVLDARAKERYRGDTEPVDARAGHIPGAKNAPWSENISNGKFLTSSELEKKYGALGAAPDRELIVYCGSGVTACHDLLALDLAGISGAKLYEGSWSDWAAQDDRAVATGDT